MFDKNKRHREIFAVLSQIYGELNRMRLIMGEGSDTGARIEKFDKESNSYDPFFASDEAAEKYKALKVKYPKKGKV